MGNIKLGNREFSIENFHFSHAFAGMLVGSPDKETINEILAEFRYPLNWGVRKSVFHLQKDYLHKSVPKAVIYTAWLDSDPVNDLENEFDGSYIVVSWFGGEQIDRSIIQIIEDGLSGFDYLNNAQNYNF